MIILILNKAGKRVSVYLGIIFGGVILIIAAMFGYVLSGETVGRIIRFLSEAMGFMSDGTINHLFPVLTLLVIIAALGIGSYAVIRRTEL